MQIKKKKLLVYFCIILENLMINVLFLTLESELGSKQKRNNKVHPNDNKNTEELNEAEQFFRHFTKLC